MALPDQRGVDREFPVAGEELTRAVERIDKEEFARFDDRRASGDRLLGDDSRSRRQCVKARMDRRFGALVGFGDRAAVGLFAMRAAFGINLHDRRSRGERDQRELKGDFVSRQQRKIPALGHVETFGRLACVFALKQTARSAKEREIAAQLQIR